MGIFKNVLYALFIAQLFFVNFSSLFGQEKSEILAEINGVAVYQSEVEQRYEFMPQPGRENSKDQLVLKEEILHTIIAERLWAEEERKTPIDPHSILSSILKYVEKIHLRDALYTHEIKNKLNFSDKDISEALQKKSRILFLNYFYSPDIKETNSLYEKLNKGEQFDELFSTRPEKKSQDRPLQITFGDYDESTENQLYALLPGEFTQPIKLEDGWYIFSLRDISKSEQDNSFDSIEKVKKVLAARQSETRLARYYREFFGNKTAKTIGGLFKQLLAVTENIYLQKLESFSETNIPDKITFDYMDIQRMETLLGDSVIFQQFVQLENRAVTLSETLREIIFDGFSIPVNDSVTIGARLNASIKSFTEKEYLTDEAYRKGLLNNQDVQQSIQMWHNYYLGNAFKHRFTQNLNPSSESLEKYLRDEKEKSKNPFFNKPMEEIKDSLISMFRGRFENDKLIEKTIDLANQNKITINADLLQKMNLTNINMIVYRYFGFGGKMLAVPLSAPFAEWYRIWQNQKVKPVF